MNLKNISDELKQKAKACSTADELLALAKSEGIELSDKQIEAISGGSFWDLDCDTYDETEDRSKPFFIDE